jgi:excisionase family DNA binding protein
MSVKIGELELYTVEELSSSLGIQERTIREYLKAGKIRGRKLAKRWYVTEEALREYFEADEPEPEERQYEPG